MSTWEAFMASRDEAWFGEFLEFLRLPSVSTDKAHPADMVATADWVAARLKRAGVPTVDIVTGYGHPLVHGEWIVNPDHPRVLIYGHYDVQPVEPLELWHTPPFEPDVRDGRVYARGSGDMKANLINVIHAVETFAHTADAPPVNLIFLFEGEEEIGSPNLPRYVDEHKERLAADVVINSDGGVSGPDVPSLSVGLKGLSGMQIDIKTAASDLHSGFYGAAVASATQVALQLAATFHDDEGRVAVEGFYDAVTPLSERDRADIAGATANRTDPMAEARAFSSWGEPEYTIFERVFGRPTLDINGLWGGFTSEGWKSITPGDAHLKVTCRLVPDQDPDEIFDLVRAHVARHILPGVHWEVTSSPGHAWPYRLPREHPVLAKAAIVMEELFGAPPVFTRSGGSVPITSAFLKSLGAYSVSFAFSQPGNNSHAPNEWFRVEDLDRGRRGNYRLLELLGEMRDLQLRDRA